MHALLNEEYSESIGQNFALLSLEDVYEKSKDSKPRPLCATKSLYHKVG